MLRYASNNQKNIDYYTTCHEAEYCSLENQMLAYQFRN